MVHISNIDDVETGEPGLDGTQGVSMAVMVGREHGAPNFSMRQVRLDAGGHTPHHSHDYEHEVFVIDGAGEVLLDGKWHALRKGDTLLVPAEEVHQFRAPDMDMRFLCFVPASRDCGQPTPGS